VHAEGWRSGEWATFNQTAARRFQQFSFFGRMLGEIEDLLKRLVSRVRIFERILRDFKESASFVRFSLGAKVQK
jgi:hypothetical protein